MLLGKHGSLGVVGDSINMNCKDIKYEDVAWIELDQDGVQ
jgi:hypothetical protein